MDHANIDIKFSGTTTCLLTFIKIKFTARIWVIRGLLSSVGMGKNGLLSLFLKTIKDKILLKLKESSLMEEELRHILMRMGSKWDLIECG